MSEQVDITDFGPNQYIVQIDLPGTNGEKKAESVTITRNNFLLRRIEYVVVGSEALVAENNDFQIDWSIDNQIRFFKGTPPMAQIFGNTLHGRWLEFEPPIPINQQQTLYVELTNRYDASAQGDRKIQVSFIGMEDKAPSKGMVTK